MMMDLIKFLVKCYTTKRISKSNQFSSLLNPTERFRGILIATMSSKSISMMVLTTSKEEIKK